MSTQNCNTSSKGVNSLLLLNISIKFLLNPFISTFLTKVFNSSFILSFSSISSLTKPWNIPIVLPNLIISLYSSYKSLSKSFNNLSSNSYFKYLLFNLANLLAIILSFVEDSSSYSGIFPLFFSSTHCTSFSKASKSVSSKPSCFFVLSTRISLLFTKSITIDCFLTSPTDIALPIL